MPTTISEPVEKLACGVGESAKELWREATTFTHKALESEPARELIDRVGRTIKRTRRGIWAAADLCDETAHCIKRRPFGAVAVTFGSGLLAGLVAGRLVAKFR